MPMIIETALMQLQEETAQDVLVRHGFIAMSDEKTITFRFMKHPDGRVCLIANGAVLFHDSEHFFNCKDDLELFLATGMLMDTETAPQKLLDH